MNNNSLKSIAVLTSSMTAGILLAASAQDPVNRNLRQPGESADFSYDQAVLPAAKPWTTKSFKDNPRDFQFVIIGDRTGGANAQGTFKMAMDQINLLQPEFVINVGDVIEGYSDDKAELHAEWDDVDKMLNTLEMPFFRTPGNHDIANKTAQAVWRERHGATYYYFVYKDVLFMILDSEDGSRPAPPPGMKDKIELYNRLANRGSRQGSADVGRVHV